MKKSIQIIATALVMLFGNSVVGQNDTMFVIKNGVVTHSILVDSNHVDSIIFYRPESFSNTGGYEIWTGPDMEFIKESGADPTDPLHQDQITASVSITRGDKGEIYNAVSETKSEKGISPKGTEWAVGETSNISNLTFKTYRNAVGSPQQAVGKKLVLHIIEEDIYLSVEIKSWESGRLGGFSYIRSTEN